MTQRIQISRSSVPGNRPASFARPIGELYINFPDRQLGVMLPDGAAQDLIAVPFYSEASGYAEGAVVRRDSRLLRALEDVPPGTEFDAVSWADIEGGIPVSGVPPVEPQENDLWLDVSGTHPDLKRYDGVSAWVRVLTGYLTIGGGTLTGPLGLLPGATPALAFGAADTGLAWVDGLRVVLGGAVRARTWYDPGAPTGTPAGATGDDVLPTRAQGDARWLRLDGGTMAGALTLAGTPSQPLHAASKAYVDGKAGGAAVQEGPPAAIEGSFWYDTLTGVLACHDGFDWIAVGGAAKVSRSGGTMTGHLEVPAAASGSQVPRASEVLLANGTVAATARISFNAGLRIPQRTTGEVWLQGEGAPADGIRFRFGGAGGAGGALGLTSADSAWLTLTPSTQTLATSTGTLQLTGSLRASAQIRLHSELTFERTGGASYVNWPADDLHFRRADTVVATIGAGGAALPNAVTLVTREKGDDRWVKRTASNVPMAAALDMGGFNIHRIGQLSFSAIDAVSPDYLAWDALLGLRGFGAGVSIFDIGPTSARMAGVYADTDSSGANVFVTATGQLRRSTSSRETKAQIRPLTDAVRLIRHLLPVTFTSRLHPDEKARRFAGFIAEEVAETFPAAAQDDGLNYDVRAIVAALVGAMQTVLDRLDRLDPPQGAT